MLLDLGQKRLFVAKNKKDCSSLGAKDIGTIEECQAIARITNMPFSLVWNNATFPKRCHLMDNNNNRNIYWNSHKIGGTFKRSAPICKFGW